MNALLFPGLGASSSTMVALYCRLRTAIAAANEPAWVASVDRDIDAQIKSEEAEQRLMHGVNLLSLRLWSQHGENFEHVCGHSLGFYAALVAAEVINEEDSFVLLDTVMRLSKKRSLPLSILKTITSVQPLEPLFLTQSIGGEIICINAPNQVVLHGLPANFRLLHTILPSSGLCKVNDLVTSVPFHSSLLKAVSQCVRDFMHASDIRFHSPTKIIWSHVDAKLLKSLEEIIETIAMQIAKPVCWEATVLEMQKHGVKRFAEVTPSRMLSRILRWIDPDICLIPSIQGMGSQA